MINLTGRRVLVLDDEPLVRGAIVGSLRALGAAVTEAEDGQQALELYAPAAFDVVLTDYSMPGMNGDEVAHSIRARCPSQRIVMLSGSSEDTRQNSRAMAAIDVLLEKPCPLDALSAALA